MSGVVLSHYAGHFGLLLFHLPFSTFEANCRTGFYAGRSEGDPNTTGETVARNQDNGLFRSAGNSASGERKASF
jgi:hypothetical protein